MKNQSKTKQALIQELVAARQRIEELEQSGSAYKNAEKALRESEDRYRSLFDNSNDAVLLAAPDGRILAANPEACRIFGRTEEEICRIGRAGLIDQTDPRLAEALEERARTGRFQGELIFVRKDGVSFPGEVSSTIFRDRDGNLRTSMIIRDMTEKRRAERDYQTLFREMLDGFALHEILCDAQRQPVDYRFLTINPAFERMTGLKAEQIVGRTVLEVLPGTERHWIEAYGRVALTGEPTFFENYSKALEKYFVVTAFQPAPNQFACIFVDITDRKRAEEALTQSEERFRKAFYTSPDSVNINRLEDGMYVSINPGFTRITGYTEADIVGKTSIEYNIWGNIEDRQKLVDGLKRDGEVVNLEAAFRMKNGEIRYGLMSASVIELNGVPHILNITRDITDRRRAEESLRESEKKYRLLADNVNDVIFVLDMNLNYTYVSPSVKILRGYEPEEALKQTAAEALTPSSCDLAMRTLSEVMELEKSEHREPPISRTLRLEMVRKDGTPVWTEVKFSFIRDEERRPVGILGVTRNIAERERAEKELQQTLESLRNAVGTTIQVMVSAVETRDPYTAGHQLRSADLARAIATEMGLSQDKIHGLRMAGSIHDIGKLSIPAEILSKPTKLTKIEFSLIQEHSRKGYEMLKDVESPWPLAQIVHQHHERMNGSGYPGNLKGDDILIEARILAVADVVESMASHRPYRPALGIGAALEEIEKNRGILYDPDAADACLRLFREKGFNLEKI